MAPQSRAGLDQNDRRDRRRPRANGSPHSSCPPEIRRLGLAPLAGLGDPPTDHLGHSYPGNGADLDAVAPGSAARGAAEGRVVSCEGKIVRLEVFEGVEEGIHYFLICHDISFSFEYIIFEVFSLLGSGARAVYCIDHFVLSSFLLFSTVNDVG